MQRSPAALGWLLVLALALGLRVGAVAWLDSAERRAAAYEHGRIAENLVAGRGFTITFLGVEGPTSQQAPLYPLMLAGLYTAFAPAAPEAHLAMQLLQCLAGTALVACVVWCVRIFLPGRPAAAWVAGAGAAVYPPHVYMVTHLQVAVWVALLLALAVCVACSPRWQRSTWGAGLLGLVSGTLLLFEPIMALALPFLAAAWWRGAARERGLRCWSAAALRPVVGTTLVAALIVAPWLWRNGRVHGEPVFVKTTFGYAFWQGNNPASWGTDKIPKPNAERLRHRHDGTLAGIDAALWEARHETLYIDDVLLKPTGYREFQGLTEPERSRLLMRRARAFIAEEPAAYARLCLRRLRYFLLWDETNPKARNLVYRASSLAWLLLAAVGIVVSRRSAARLWPTYAIFAVVVLFHTLTITSARFRIPVEPLSFVWAASAVVWIAGRARRAGRGRGLKATSEGTMLPERNVPGRAPSREAAA